MPSNQDRTKHIVNGEFVNCLCVEPVLVDSSEGPELRLTINFASTILKTYLGKFEIGLRRGDLRVSLKGALAHLENRWPVHEMNPHQEVQRNTRTSRHENATTTEGVTGSARLDSGAAGLDVKREAE